MSDWDANVLNSSDFTGILADIVMSENCDDFLTLLEKICYNDFVHMTEAPECYLQLAHNKLILNNRESESLLYTY